MASRHSGQWVALKTDRRTVVGTGRSVDQALRSARKNGVEHPVITRMPKQIRSFVGGYRQTA